MQQPYDYDVVQLSSQHYTFLLRIWRADASQPWRITLRRVGGTETQHFSSLNGLINALWNQLAPGTREENG